MAEVGQNSSIIEAKLCGTLRGAEVVSSGGIDVSCDDEIAIATVCGIFIAVRRNDKFNLSRLLMDVDAFV